MHHRSPLNKKQFPSFKSILIIKSDIMNSFHAGFIPSSTLKQGAPIFLSVKVTVMCLWYESCRNNCSTLNIALLCHFDGTKPQETWRVKITAPSLTSWPQKVTGIVFLTTYFLEWCTNYQETQKVLFLSFRQLITMLPPDVDLSTIIHGVGYFVCLRIL